MNFLRAMSFAWRAAAIVGLLSALPASQAQTAPRLVMPHSYNPFTPYRASQVPEPTLTNSPRLDQLIRDGKLYLSLQNAIDLALENNLDLAIARYNLPIADTDMLRTKAGGSVRGVNTGVVQGTPGGGVGGYGAGAAGAGAGGTTGGAGGAGAGTGGLVQSTLGAGTFVSSFDPALNVFMDNEHSTTGIYDSSFVGTGISALHLNTNLVNMNYSQAFPIGASISVAFNNNRLTTNSPNYEQSPLLSSYVSFSFQQQLLAGFGFGPNLRYVRIARNNKKISDIAFKSQVIATITQIENMYWDLVGAYEQTRVNEQSLAFANQTLENAKKQLQLESIPELDVMKDETEVAKRDQDLTTARTSLQLQESLMKNALTKSLDDPVLEAMPVVPTDTTLAVDTSTPEAIADLISHALENRAELIESNIEMDNWQLSRKTARNALLPSLSLIGSYSGSSLGGVPNPAFTGSNASTAPGSWIGVVKNDFNYSSPDYLVGLNLNIPLRNRQAKADQYRSELEFRQTELRMEQQKKQIRIEVRNARYALEQTAARVEAARKARDLAQRTFEITQQEQKLGAGSTYQTITARHDLALAELDLVTAMTAYEKAKVELDRATGSTLDHNGIAIQDAINGTVSSPAP